MILWSLRSFWVERFDLNQSQKIDFGRKSFLYQCKNSARNRFFPRSRLGQVTYRKSKPHASWPLQMRRGVPPPRCIAIAWGGYTPPGGEKPTAAAACYGYPIILLYRGCLGTCQEFQRPWCHIGGGLWNCLFHFLKRPNKFRCSLKSFISFSTHPKTCGCC